jgi:hypothetical protein
MNANVKEKTGTPLALPEGSLYEVAREEMEKILKGEAMGSRMVEPDQWAEKSRRGPYQEIPASHKCGEAAVPLWRGSDQGFFRLSFGTG